MAAVLLVLSCSKVSRIEGVSLLLLCCSGLCLLLLHHVHQRHDVWIEDRGVDGIDVRDMVTWRGHVRDRRVGGNSFS